MQTISEQIEPAKKELESLKELHKGKKDNEIDAFEKEHKEKLQAEVDELSNRRSNLLKEYGKNTQLVSQLFDLALLSNNMLKGESLNRFVMRSLDLLEK